MKKAFFLFAFFFLVSCSGKQSLSVSDLGLAEDLDTCKFSNSEVDAPSWACGSGFDGYYLTSVGFYSKNDGNSFNYRVLMAKKDAKYKMDEKIKFRVMSVSRKYLSSIRDVEPRKIKVAVSSIVNNIDSDYIDNSPEVLSVKESPKGEVFLLFGINKTQNYNIVKNAVELAMKENQALWQEFISDNSLDYQAIVSSIANAS